MKTPHTMPELVSALWFAHQDVFGGPCPVVALKMWAADVAFETADGRAVNGENVGNMRGHGDAGSVAIAGADEVINGKLQIIEGGFAAYSSLRAGCRAYLAYLGKASHPPKPNRYDAAWAAALVGDVPGFVHGIRHPDDGGVGKLCAGCGRVHMGGYFTADEALYAKGVAREFNGTAGAAVDAFVASLSW